MTTAELDVFFAGIDVGDVISVTYRWHNGNVLKYRARVGSLDSFDNNHLRSITFENGRHLFRVAAKVGDVLMHDVRSNPAAEPVDAVWIFSHSVTQEPVLVNASLSK